MVIFIGMGNMRFGGVYSIINLQLFFTVAKVNVRTRVCCLFTILVYCQTEFA